MSPRQPVVKTYKLLIGGAFVRSESGRSDVVRDHAGTQVANVPRGSRKDVRDAVKAARGAFPKWQARTAYNRGQILYRLAEALESRAGELAARSASLRGIERAAARRELEAAVDAAVHHLGRPVEDLAAVVGRRAGPLAERGPGRLHRVADVLARTERRVGEELAGGRVHRV